MEEPVFDNMLLELIYRGAMVEFMFVGIPCIIVGFSHIVDALAEKKKLRRQKRYESQKRNIDNTIHIDYSDCAVPQSDNVAGQKEDWQTRARQLGERFRAGEITEDEYDELWDELIESDPEYQADTAYEAFSAWGKES